jgi:hypothetical protein
MASRPAPARKASAKSGGESKPAAAVVVTSKSIFKQLGETPDLPKKQADGLLANSVAAMTTSAKRHRIGMSAIVVAH